jgi:chromosome segregation ATPase
MDIDTLVTILGLLGAREVVAYLLGRRKTQAEVRATDAGTAGEIAGAAGVVVELLRTEVEILKEKFADLKVDHDGLLKRAEDAEAFKKILEAERRHDHEMYQALEEAFAKQAQELDELRTRLRDTIGALNEMRHMEQTVTRHSEQVVDLQDEVKALKAENKKLRGQVRRLKEENAELREQINGNGHDSEPAG